MVSRLQSLLKKGLYGWSFRSFFQKVLGMGSSVNVDVSQLMLLNSSRGKISCHFMVLRRNFPCSQKHLLSQEIVVLGLSAILRKPSMPSWP
jgi:hypothetical protein